MADKGHGEYTLKSVGKSDISCNEYGVNNM